MYVIITTEAIFAFLFLNTSILGQKMVSRQRPHTQSRNYQDPPTLKNQSLYYEKSVLLLDLQKGTYW